MSLMIIGFMLFAGAFFMLAIGGAAWLLPKFFTPKESIKKIDFSDGISAEEMAIIRDALFAKRSAEVEAKVKADVIEALKSK